MKLSCRSKGCFVETAIIDQLELYTESYADAYTPNDVLGLFEVFDRIDARIGGGRVIPARPLALVCHI